jgi:hypothetical protein
MSSLLDRVVDGCPSVVLYALVAGGRDSLLYGLRCDQETLGELNPGTLKQTAREAEPTTA